MILIIDECVKLYKANVENYKHTQIYMFYTQRITPRLNLPSTLFTQNFKKIKCATHKNGNLDGAV